MVQAWDQSYNRGAGQSSDLRPVRSDASRSLLVFCGRHDRKSLGIATFLLGSRETATRRIVLSVIPALWNAIKASLNFLIAISNSYSFSTHSAAPLNPPGLSTALNEQI